VLELSWYHTTQRPGESVCQGALVEPQIPDEKWGFRPGRGTIDQLFTDERLLKGSREFAQPVYMCFVDLEKAFDSGFLWGVLWAIRSLYACSKSCVCILCNNSDSFPVGVGLRQGCPLSPVSFVLFKDRISRWRRSGVGVSGSPLCCLQMMWSYWHPRTVISCIHWGILQGMRVSTSKSEALVLCRKPVDCSLQVGTECLHQAKEFKYLGVLFTSEGKMEREIHRWIVAAAAVKFHLGEEGIEPEGKALNLLVGVRSKPSPKFTNSGS